MLRNVWIVVSERVSAKVEKPTYQSMPVVGLQVGSGVVSQATCRAIQGSTS